MDDVRTRLYLVRHGETEWNKSLKYQGHQDIPLSETGIRQAQKLAGRMTGIPLDSVYSSDLSRAMETAKIITAAHNLKVRLKPELRETNFGRWEGLTYVEIDSLYHDAMSKWRENPMDTVIPEGESLGQVAERCKLGIQEIIDDNQGKNILVVAHGGVIRVILAQCLGMDLKFYWKLKQDNVALNIVDFYGPERMIVGLVNDTTHLD